MSFAGARLQFIRYAVVGLGSNLLLYLAYLGLTNIGLGYKTAMSFLYLLGVSATFIANRKWSFEHEGQARAAFVRYAIAYILGYLLNFTLLWFAVDLLHLPHQAVQAVGIVLVAACLFLMQRHWVFAPAIRNENP